MIFPPDLEDLASKIIRGFTLERKKIVTAESCTGGLIGALLTSIPGSSNVVERGFITYSNDAKVDLLGVLPDMLQEFGAVSAEVAEAMATGALEYSLSDVAVSVTGIAGPDGGVPGKPVGLVYIGLTTRAGITFHSKCQFSGDRQSIRLQAAHEALTLLAAQIGD